MISSGPMEGTNNKIKTMKRQAYGFRDMEFFKLKILAIHETNLLSAHRTVDFPEYPLRWLELATGCPLGARLAERGRTRTFMRFAPAIGW